MPKAPTSESSPRQIGTRASNKFAHPGKITMTSVPRRSSAEKQHDLAAKAKVKADKEAAKKKSIARAAEFEQTCMADEEMADATPRPLFTPKRRTNKRKAIDSPLIEDDSVAEDESAIEYVTEPEDETENEPVDKHDDPNPPTKKQKTQVTEKAASAKVAKGGRKVGNEKVVVAASEDEQTPKPKPKPKPKKEKVKVRDEINLVAKNLKIENEVKKNKYAVMMESTPSKPPSHRQAAEGGGSMLKREGAIADINALYKKKVANSDQNVSTGNNNSDLMDIDNSDTSHEKEKKISAVSKWASTISTLAHTAGGHTKSTMSNSSRAKSGVPSLTSGTSTGRSYAPSVLSDNVKIITQQLPDVVKVEDEPAPALSLYNNGGLSDNDEMRGEEREVAVRSPPKGKRRITSENLVLQKPPKTSSETAKKPRNKELPDWVDTQWFRHTFVTSYMAFVGQTTDPWDVPVKQSLEVMQKIWDATSRNEYKITTSTAIYQKTVQRLADSWRNVIGSTGIAVLMAFFESQQDLRDSDKERVDFAKFYLEDLRFLYKDSTDDNKKKWKGLFRAPFVLQTFAAHLGAIEGSVKVSDLHGLGKPTPLMVGGLGLAAASVERALTLVATGTLTVEMSARTIKGKSISLPRTINQSTGKESMRQTGFSDVAWGKVTRGYATSARSLANVKFEAIIQDTKEFLKPIRSRNKSSEALDIIDVDDEEDDERAHLVDNDSDEN